MAEIDRHFAPHEPEREMAARAITADVMDRLMPVGPRLRLSAVLLGVLFLIGVAAFVARLLTSGLEYRAGWGYLNATFAFLLATTQAAPLFGIGLQLAHADWRRQIVRIGQLFTMCGPLILLIYVPLLLALPPTEGRRTLWISWPWVAPAVVDTIAVVLVVIHGLALLYLAAIPDFAAARDYLRGSRRGLYARLALGWQGTQRQWTGLRSALVLLGVFYFMLMAYVQILIPVDFAMSLVPGWDSTVLPAYQMVTSLEAAVALVVVAAYLWRRFGGLDRYIRNDHFASSGPILFSLALLSFYLWWSDFLTRWYGRTPREQNLLLFLDFGSYFVPWLLAFLLLFLIPFALLLWRPIRHSVLGLTLVSAGVLVGTFFDRVRIYVGAFTVEDVTARQLDTIPAARPPDALDVLMIFGALAGAGLLYLAASKLVPPLAIWETKEDLLLRLHRPFLKDEYLVLGKPH